MLQFAWPWMFILLPLPWLVYRFLPHADVLGAGLRVPFFNTLQPIKSKPLLLSKPYRSLRTVLLGATWLLLIIALSNPQWLGKPTAMPRQGRDLMLAVDLSGSMQTPDMKLNGKSASRLHIVKHVAKEFINARQGDRLGLIVFGTQAYLQTPLTFDRQTVNDMLQDTSIGLAGEQTAMGDAIGLAVKRLLPYPSQSRAIILLTDGGNNAGTVQPLAAAKLAAQQGIKIYTIGIGAESWTMPGLFGPEVVNPSEDLDVKTLKKIADITGGKFFRAEQGDDLQTVYDSINQLEPVAADNDSLRPLHPLYPWPLALALLFSVVLAWRYVVPVASEATHD